MDEILSLILRNKNFGINDYYELLTKYDKKNCHDAFNFIMKNGNDVPDERFQDVYMLIELDSMHINMKSYDILIAKYGEDRITDFLYRLIKARGRNIDAKFKPLYLCIDFKKKTDDDYKGIDPSDNSLPKYLRKVSQFSLLTETEEVLLFWKLLFARENISIVCSNEFGVYNIPIKSNPSNDNPTDNNPSYIHNILASITSNEQYGLLKKLSNYLNGPDEFLVKRYITLWKEANKDTGAVSVIPCYSNLHIGNTPKIYDGDFLTHQLENLVIYYQTREKIICCNLKFAYIMSKKCWNNKNGTLDIDDFIQEANIGIMRAVHEFDVTLGNKLSTLAVKWIGFAFTNILNRSAHSIRLPKESLALVKKYRRVLADFEKLYGRIPTTDEIAAQLGIPPEKIIKITSLLNLIDMLSLDAPIEGENGYFFTLTNGIAASIRDIEGLIEEAELISKIKSTIEELSEDDKKLLNLRFASLPGRNLSYDKIAPILGITRQGVQVRMKRLIKIIKKTCDGYI